MLQVAEKKPIAIDIKWLPEDIWDAAKFHYTFRLTRGERKILRKRKLIPVSEWAERHRTLTMSSVPGKWKNATTPYLAGIMDASFFPSVQTIIICAAPQTGKSECVNNCVGYAVDRRPGSVLYIYPDEQTARDNSKDRIQAMLTSSRRLKSYMTGYDDDVSYLRINMKHMQIYMGWARSASRLANKPLPYVIFDETDKYPETAGKKEADPISLGEKRTRTYRSMRKIWKLSTPTMEDGAIWIALNKEAQVVFDYWVRCPICEAWQHMKFENIKWPKDKRNPEEMEAKDLAWYECDACRAKWDDDMRNRAVKAGQWRAREKNLSLETYLKSFKPKKIGFHIPSWLSYFVGLSEAAAAFLRGLTDKTKLKDFLNAHKAEPWKVYEIERDEDRILALRDERPRGTVPGGDLVASLTAGVDTQKHGFWYEIRAWGWGMEKESWQIREGFVPTFDALALVLWEDEYKDPEDKPYIVQMAVMDAMGEKTAEVYDFCRLNRGRVYPFQGVQRMNQPFTYTNLEYYPPNAKGVKRPIPGGLKLLRGNVTYYKNDLSNILEISPADPGAWHMHSETTAEWAIQMCAEYVDEKGIWQVAASRDNHAWDCSVYNLVAADVIGVKYWKKTPPKKEEQTEQSQRNQKPPSGWLGGRAGNGWLNK